VALYHFSENPGIEIFVPRPPLAHPQMEPLVWAIDDWHSPIYFLPSDCPRATFWPVHYTTPEDRRLYWPDESIRMVVAIESAWFERFMNTSLYRYLMPESSFAPREDFGVHVSEETVLPLRVEAVGPLWKAMSESSVELRIMPSLRAFAHQLMETSFHWSLIRMRNVLDWDVLT
jgi:uncharacterized protein DUF6886